MLLYNSFHRYPFSRLLVLVALITLPLWIIPATLAYARTSSIAATKQEVRDVFHFDVPHAWYLLVKSGPVREGWNDIKAWVSNLIGHIEGAFVVLKTLSGILLNRLAAQVRNRGLGLIVLISYPLIAPLYYLFGEPGEEIRDGIRHDVRGIYRAVVLGKDPTK